MNGSSWNQWPKVVWYVYTRWIILSFFFQTQKYDISVEIQNFQTPLGVMVWGSRVPSLAGGKWMVVLQIYDRRLPDKHAHANISKSFFQCGKYDISVKIQNFQKISKTPRGNDVRKPCTKVGWWKMNGSRWNRWPKVVWYVYSYTRGELLKSFFFKRRNTIFQSKFKISEKFRRPLGVML